MILLDYQYLFLQWACIVIWLTILKIRSSYGWLRGSHGCLLCLGLRCWLPWPPRSVMTSRIVQLASYGSIYLNSGVARNATVVYMHSPDQHLPVAQSLPVKYGGIRIVGRLVFILYFYVLYLYLSKPALLNLDISVFALSDKSGMRSFERTVSGQFHFHHSMSSRPLAFTA